MKPSIKNLRNYLDWLITPQNAEEQARFKIESLVDDYIKLKNRIPDMTEEELIKEIDIQLKPYELSYDKVFNQNENKMEQKSYMIKKLLSDPQDLENNLSEINVEMTNRKDCCILQKGDVILYDLQGPRLEVISTDGHSFFILKLTEDSVIKTINPKAFEEGTIWFTEAEK